MSKWIPVSLFLAACLNFAPVEAKALYTQHRVSLEHCLQGDRCAHWRQDFPLLGPEILNAKSINSKLLGYLGAKKEQDLKDHARAWFEEYKAFVKESVGLDTPWTYEGQMQVEHLSPRLLSLRNYAYRYAGGAHGVYSTEFYNLDLQSGQPVKLEQLLKEGALEQLNLLAEAQFRKQREIPADQSLGEAGYSFPDDRFALNDNFLLTPRGLHFLFNVYEVGSYAAGAIELTLYEWQITDLIRDYGKDEAYYHQLLKKN